jgi:CheY-like chemotaxis protein
MSRKVLVVEDEVLVAIEIESVVEELGLSPIGIAADATSALALADHAELALVDLNLLDGPTGGPLGVTLAERGVTVLFMTANPAQLGQGLPGTLGVLPKPVGEADLRNAVTYAIAHRERRDATPPRRLKLFSPVLH